MKEQGSTFKVVIRNDEALAAKNRALGVPDALTSCHTSVVGNDVLEGNVTATTMRRLLVDRPAVLGLAVPGMPLGSPGMRCPANQAILMM